MRPRASTSSHRRRARSAWGKESIPTLPRESSGHRERGRSDHHRWGWWHVHHSPCRTPRSQPRNSLPRTRHSPESHLEPLPVPGIPQNSRADNGGLRCATLTPCSLGTTGAPGITGISQLEGAGWELGKQTLHGKTPLQRGAGPPLGPRDELCLPSDPGWPRLPWDLAVPPPGPPGRALGSFPGAERGRAPPQQLLPQLF